MLTQDELRSLKVESVVGIEMRNTAIWPVSVISSFVDRKILRILTTPVNSNAQAYDFSIETGIEVHASHSGMPYRLIRAEDARNHNNMIMLRSKRRNLNHEIKAYISKGDVTLVGEIDFFRKEGCGITTHCRGDCGIDGKRARRHVSE